MSVPTENKAVSGMLGYLGDKLQGYGNTAAADALRSGISQKDTETLLEVGKRNRLVLQDQKQQLRAGGAVAEQHARNEALIAIRNRQALAQSQGLRVEQQQAAHQNLGLLMQKDRLDALNHEYQIECAYPGVYHLPHLEAYNAMTPEQQFAMYGTYQDPTAVTMDLGSSDDDDDDQGGTPGGGPGGAPGGGKVKDARFEREKRLKVHTEYRKAPPGTIPVPKSKTVDHFDTQAAN